MAEELRLDELGGERAAVENDERLGSARAVRVQRLRDELFAGAGLAGDEDGGVARRDLADELHQLPHRAALPEDALELEALAEHGDPLIAAPVEARELEIAREDRRDQAGEVDGRGPCGVVEGVRLRRVVEVEHPERGAAGDERDDQHRTQPERLDALLMVEALVVLRVANDERIALAQREIEDRARHLRLGRRQVEGAKGARGGKRERAVALAEGDEAPLRPGELEERTEGDAHALCLVGGRDRPERLEKETGGAAARRRRTVRPERVARPPERLFRRDERAKMVLRPRTHALGGRGLGDDLELGEVLRGGAEQGDGVIHRSSSRAQRRAPLRSGIVARGRVPGNGG